MGNNSTFSFASANALAQQAGRGVWRSLEQFLRKLVDGTLVISPRVATGVIASTATTMTVNLGFTPDAVTVINVTDGTRMEWIGDTNGQGFLTGNVTSQYVASGGITAITTAGSEGFSVGTNIAGVSKTLRYTAIKKRPTA